MKKLLRNCISEIRVEILVEELHQLVSIDSSIRPVQPNYPIDNNIDEQALADYNSFIEDTKAEIEDLDLEIIDSNSSKRSYTSRYFTIVDLEQHLNHTLKYMIFLRISDHLDADFGNQQQNIDQAIRNHRDKLQQQISNEQGHKVIWKVREIIVNGERFITYDEAIEYIRQLAQQWSEMLRNNTRSN